MKKDIAEAHIRQHIPSDETLIGFFQAMLPLKIWLFILIGPLACLSMRFYFIGVTDKGVHLFRLNMMGKFNNHDFFTYDEIDSLKIGKGLLQTPLLFIFTNKRKFKCRAQRKGANRVAKFGEETKNYLIERIILK